MKAHSKPDPEPADPSYPPSRSIWRSMGAGSLSISLVLHLLFLVAGVIWVFQVIPSPEPEITWTQKSGSRGTPSEATETKQRSQMRSSMPKVAALDSISEIIVPEIEPASKMVALTSTGAGGSLAGIGSIGGGAFAMDGKDKGPGLLDGGRGQNFQPIPEELRQRCSRADRLARLRENGGTDACEDAVLHALRWMKANQNPDGSWGTSTPAAMTGLVLLSYFGHCETPASDEFGDSCMRGIIYLVNLGMRNDGRLSTSLTANHWSYEHAIATYALGEANTFCKQAKIDIPSLADVTAEAGQFIIDHQNANGGWAYLYATEGGHIDVSISGWQIQALKACSHGDIPFRGMNRCITRALDYVNRCQDSGGGFGYTGKNLPESGYHTLTGVGMLCNQIWEKGNRSEVRKGAKYVLENTRFDYNTRYCDLYGHYYESQAMLRRGGDEWEKYNNLFRDQLLRNQDADGSWKTPGGGAKPRATAPNWQNDKLYRTCLCTLMMEVYYRFLSVGGIAHDRPGF